ncbi:MAG TPA: protein kinase [Ktedonobacterales bacterium]
MFTLAHLINGAPLLEDSMAGMEGARLGAYELIERVGSGGMAEVYRAKQLSAFGREVAVKVIRRGFSEDPLFRQRFLREAQAIARLSHPHILPLIEFGEERDILYLVMPYFSGGTLRSLLERVQGPLSLKDATEILEQLCDAVQYAHEQGIVHRDIKPQNVLIQRGKHLLLADFGIARDTSDERLTMTGAGVGTVEYMAPEQAMGKGDKRSDVYSLGIIFFQMLGGRVPFTGSTPMETLMKQATELPAPIHTLNAALPAETEKVLNKVLEKDPRDRFQSPNQFFQAAQQLLQPRPPSGANMGARAAPLPPSTSGGQPNSGGASRPGSSGASHVATPVSGRPGANTAAGASRGSSGTEQRFDAPTSSSRSTPTRDDYRAGGPPPQQPGARAGKSSGRPGSRAAGVAPGMPGKGEPKRGGRKWLLYTGVLLAVLALGVVGVAAAQLFRSKQISATGTETPGNNPTATATAVVSPLQAFAYGFMRNYQVFAAAKGADPKQVTNIAKVGQPNAGLNGGVNFDFLASPLLFSPDGRYIACLIQIVDAPRDGFLGGNLYVIDTTTGTVTTPKELGSSRLLFSQGGDNALAWKDSQTLLIAGDTSHNPILAYDAPSGKLSAFFSPSPPDASAGSIIVRGQVAFYTVLIPSGDNGNLVLHRVDLNTHADTQLITLGKVPLVVGPGFSANGYAPFDISPDGTHILWRGANGSTPDGIWYANVDGSGVQQLFNGLDLGTAEFAGPAPSFSPDGKKVLMRTDQAVYTSNLDGSTIQKYAQNGQADWLPNSSGITIAVNTGTAQNPGPYKGVQCDPANGNCADLLDDVLALYWA